MVIISLLGDAIYTCSHVLYVCSNFQPDVVSKDGFAPLGLAVINGKLEVVKYLISEQYIDPKGM